MCAKEGVPAEMIRLTDRDLPKVIVLMPAKGQQKLYQLVASRDGNGVSLQKLDPKMLRQVRKL